MREAFLFSFLDKFIYFTFVLHKRKKICLKNQFKAFFLNKIDLKPDEKITDFYYYANDHIKCACKKLWKKENS